MDNYTFLSPIFILISFGLFGYIHTALASDNIKNRFANKQSYRIFYNIQSFILLIPILGLIVLLPDKPIYKIEGSLRNNFFIIQGISMLAIVISVWQTGLFSFLGLSPEKTNLQSTNLQMG
jgi:hypothetical protein